MAIKTDISWADSTVNLVMGCGGVGPMSEPENITTHELFELYESGLSLCRLSDRVGLPKHVIERRLKVAGYKLRPRARPRSRIVATNGYVTIFMPEHPSAMRNGYIYEHRLVMEKILGRPLKPGEQIHHLDGNKQNNDPANLSLIGISEHTRLHHRRRTDLREAGRENPVIECACGCGTRILKFDSSGRPRKYISGHNAWKKSPDLRS